MFRCTRFPGLPARTAAGKAPVTGSATPCLLRRRTSSVCFTGRRERTAHEQQAQIELSHLEITSWNSRGLESGLIPVSPRAISCRHPHLPALNVDRCAASNAKQCNRMTRICHIPQFCCAEAIWLSFQVQPLRTYGRG